jgi:hypothetical protein
LEFLIDSDRDDVLLDLGWLDLVGGLGQRRYSLDLGRLDLVGRLGQIAFFLESGGMNFLQIGLKRGFF